MALFWPADMALVWSAGMALVWSAGMALVWSAGMALVWSAGMALVWPADRIPRSRRCDSREMPAIEGRSVGNAYGGGLCRSG